MKSILMTLVGLAAGIQFAQAQPLHPSDEARKIQIAILFDTSGSMEGLIEQAKSTIWKIVNMASKMSDKGKAPQLEIALYDYGNDEIKTPNWIRKRTDLIADLDSISGQLFSLRTNGGSEYCAAVIEASMNDLKWSPNPTDLRLIYIAGNEPFNQGPIDYKKILKTAAEKDIIVNTIYCGAYEQGVKEFWYDGALQTQGSYFNINSNEEIQHIDTPYDKEIISANDSLNKTYIGYGKEGVYRASKQATEDHNASSKGYAVMSERAEAKSKSNYKNASWDLVDGLEDGTIKLDSIRAEDLPAELKGKSKAEQTKYIETKKADRTKYQNKIGELSKKREEYIVEERKKLSETNAKKDLGTAIIESLVATAQKTGFTVE
ncbi:MAG: vWA domain-containing protein [Fluviicola sp.]